MKIVRFQGSRLKIKKVGPVSQGQGQNQEIPTCHPHHMVRDITITVPKFGTYSIKNDYRADDI